MTNPRAHSSAVWRAPMRQDRWRDQSTRPPKAEYSIMTVLLDGTMSQPRYSIDQRVQGNPRSHHEIPVKSIVAHITEAPLIHMPGKHEDGQHDGVPQIGQEMRRMQAEHEPRD